MTTPTGRGPRACLPDSSSRTHSRPARTAERAVDVVAALVVTRHEAVAVGLPVILLRGLRWPSRHRLIQLRSPQPGLAAAVNQGAVITAAHDSLLRERPSSGVGRGWACLPQPPPYSMHLTCHAPAGRQL